MTRLDYIGIFLARLIFLIQNSIASLLYPFLSLENKKLIIDFRESYYEFEQEIQDTKLYTWKDYRDKPWLIIDFILKFVGLFIVIMIIVLASISYFINANLDPMEGYDIPLFIWEWTGHYPNSVFFM